MGQSVRAKNFVLWVCLDTRVIVQHIGPAMYAIDVSDG